MRPKENLRILQPNAGQSGASALEAAARAVVNIRVGRILSNAEWARVRQSLLDAARALGSWKQLAEGNEHLDRVNQQQDKAA
jgi:hypothetical protein